MRRPSLHRKRRRSPRDRETAREIIKDPVTFGSGQRAESMQEIVADIARLKARRRAELHRIVAGLRAHHDLSHRLDLVLSVPGIGERTALALVIRMPELGRLSREQAAALAGLAPFDDDSGNHKGQRHIAGGRERLRRSLYAAALPAAFRWNKALVALYARLTQRGKAHNTALIACARKLPSIVMAIWRRATRSRPGSIRSNMVLL